MRAALGFKAHSGWAALIVLGVERSAYRIIERRRIELIENNAGAWAGQPYHAADAGPAADAAETVKRGVAAARRRALQEMRAAIARATELGHAPAACAVLVAEPMPEWSVAQILAVHLRMHQAEGALYPAALIRAAQRCGLDVVTVRAKQLAAAAEESLEVPPAVIAREIARLGKTAGAPWASDQKAATLAAMIALARR